jgi:hypothetical protein
MALTPPFDILIDFPGWTTSFDLVYRQEQSRAASGVTFVKELGFPLWQMNAVSKILTPNVLDYWRARLKALEGGLQTFYGYPLSRCYPILYPRGTWPTGGSFSGTTAAINSINANRKAIAVGSLPAAFVFSVGDFVQIGTTDLHQVMEGATASGGGVTPQFEVRPHIWTGVSSGAVSVLRPHCIMAVVPGSVNTDSGLDGRGNVSFSALEVRV